MRRMLLIFLIAGAVFTQRDILKGAPANGPDPAEAQLLAESCRQKLDQIKTGARSGTFSVSEKEVNAYLEVNRRRIFKSSAQTVRVRLLQDSLRVNATVDLGQADIRMSSLLAKAFLWILSGTHRLETEVSFTCKNRQGTYDFQSLKIDGIPLPLPVVRMVAAQIGRRQRTVILPAEPFALPFRIERCQILPLTVTCYIPRAPASLPPGANTPAKATAPAK